jgi:hypothetical protein
MDWGVKTVRQLQQVFEPYRMVFKCAGGRNLNLAKSEEWLYMHVTDVIITEISVFNNITPTLVQSVSMQL